MIAKFRISEDDYAAAMKTFARMTRARWALLAGLAVLVVVGALLSGPAMWPIALGGLGGGVGVILIALIVAPVMARRHYRKYKAMHSEFGAELLDNGLRLSSPHGEGTIVWENILKWRQNDRFVLIYPMPRIFHILPKSVAEQGFDLQGLIAQLKQRVGPEA